MFPVNQPFLGKKNINQPMFPVNQPFLGKKNINQPMFPVNQRFCPIFTNAFFWTGQVLEALKEKRTLPSNSQLADMAVSEPSWG